MKTEQELTQRELKGQNIKQVRYKRTGLTKKSKKGAKVIIGIDIKYEKVIMKIILCTKCNILFFKASQINKTDITNPGRGLGGGLKTLHIKYDKKPMG